MVKKEGTETPPEVRVPEVTPPEVTPPTAEEQLATLQEQIQGLTKERDEAKKGLSTAHSTLTEKDRKIKEQADLTARLDGFEETQKILAGMLNERIASGEGLEPTERKDYLAQFDEITKRQKKEREDAQTRTQQEEYSRQCDAIYANAKEAFKDDEDALFQVRTFLMSGATDLAEQKIAKAKAKSTDTKEKVVESEEDRIERIAEEKLRKKMEEKGMLESDAGSPAGAGAGGSYTPARLKELQSTQAGRMEIAKNIDKIVEEARAGLKK